MKATQLIFVLSLFLWACSGGSDKAAISSDDFEMASEAYYEEEVIPVTRQAKMTAANPHEPAPAKTNSLNEQQISEQNALAKKIIKDGRISVTVSNIDKSKARVDSILKINNGYAAKENLNNDDYSSRLEMTLRIPAKNFEVFLESIESGEGEITYKSINARDVTEEFIDLESRLESKRKYEQQYLELLKKASKISDILDIQERIRRLQEEIESTEGRLRYLRDQVSFSTLHLTMTYKKEYIYKPQKQKSFWERLKKSTSHGWKGFISFILGLVGLWPLWVLIWPVWKLWKFLWRKVKRKDKTESK